MSMTDYLTGARETIADRRRQADEWLVRRLANRRRALDDGRRVREASEADRLERHLEDVAAARKLIEQHWGKDIARKLDPLMSMHALGLRLGRGGAEPRAWLIFQGPDRSARVAQVRKLGRELGLDPGGEHAPDTHHMDTATMLLDCLHAPVLAVNPSDDELRKLAAG